MKSAMKYEGVRERWEPHLREFSRLNEGRLTRLGDMKSNDGAADFWLEDGLPLSGVDLDCEGADAPLVEIMLGREGASSRSMTHTVRRVRGVVIRLAADGLEDGLDVETETGTTLLRFEPRSFE